jgi:hypothetical protein
MENRFNHFSMSIDLFYCLSSHFIPSVETSRSGGNAFTKSCDDWRDGTYEKFKEWAIGQFDDKDSNSDDEAEVPVDTQKAKDIEFEKNKKGNFVLPPIENYNTIKQRQRIIRGYVGAVYRK